MDAASAVTTKDSVCSALHSGIERQAYGEQFEMVLRVLQPAETLPAFTTTIPEAQTFVCLMCFKRCWPWAVLPLCLNLRNVFECIPGMSWRSLDRRVMKPGTRLGVAA